MRRPVKIKSAMLLLERFKNLTTGTPLRTLISSLTIALLIPITLFASTQTWELRRSAVTTDSTQEEAYFKFTDFRSPFEKFLRRFKKER